MREAIFGKYEERIGGIRIRSRDISRLEGMTDAALGLAITLLIISQDIPNTYEALISLLWSMPAFAATFMLIMMIWYWHNRFFRRYGLINGEVMALSNLLIFLVLAFVFPLKYLASVVFNQWLFNQVLGIGPLFPDAGLTSANASTAHVIFAIGFAAVFFCFAALYSAALRQRHLLELEPEELVATKMGRLAFAVVATVGLLSILPALLLSHAHGAVVAYLSLLAIWPIQYAVRRRMQPIYQREAGIGTAATP